jgi:ABC-type glycerol-3-phosphate transport system substrate-binding protein
LTAEERFVKRLIWKVTLTLLVTGAGAILLFGPRPRFDVPPGRVRILYWEKWTGLEGQEMKQIVDEFNDTVGRGKGIWVDFASMSSIDRKTLISTAAGVPPDVAGLWDNQIRQFASMNALTPLDEYAAEHGLSRDQYKRVYYDGCCYNGRLYALPSTVWTVALIWNKQIFQDAAPQLRRAGLDPDRAPRTFDELNRYAAAIDEWNTTGGRRSLVRTGYIPLEPQGPFCNVDSFWFGGTFVDSTGTRLLLDTPPYVAEYNWIRGFSERLGKDELAEFRSGFGGPLGLFDSPENPFLAGQNAMEQHGPWIAAFIEKLKPSMNRWHVPEDQLERERNFPRVTIGMSRGQAEQILGPAELSADGGTLHWLAGVKDLYATLSGDLISQTHFALRPAEIRQKYSQWGAAPFPSAVPGMDDVTYAGMDTLVIPNGSQHKKEAFEFLAFVDRQDIAERLAMLHCNLSPLAKESENYRQNHPNAYADVWDELAASPNAHPLPAIPNWTQLYDDLTEADDRAYLLQGTTAQILGDLQRHAQKDLNKALNLPEDANIQ